MAYKFNFSQMPDRLLFLIQIDGLVHDIFTSLLEGGELPNIASLMKDRPHSFGRVVTTYPSATAPSLPELFTGKWSDGFFKRPRKINAFDRLQLKALKYEFLPDAWDGEHTDLFDIFEARGEKILSLFSVEFSAATITYHDSLFFGLDALGKMSGREILSYDRKVMDKLLELAGEPPYPRLVFLGFSATDLSGHFHGPSSAVYKSSLLEIDSCIGALISFLKSKSDNGKNLYDKSVFFVFGDHGMMDSSKYIDLITLFKGEGLKTSDLGSIGHIVAEKLNPFWMQDRDILSVPGGSNITELYVRKKYKEKMFDWGTFADYDLLRNYPVQTWFQDKKVDLIALLLETEGVGEVMASIAPNVVVVHTPDRGEAYIYRKSTPQGNLIAYQPLGESADPFGYLSHPSASDMVCLNRGMTPENFTESRFDDQFWSMRDWVRVTFDSKYPGAPAFIPKAFVLHHTTSDIIVNASASYNFSKFFKGDHGVLQRESMTTTLLASGEGIKPHFDFSDFLWVDFLPTVLKLMRIEAPAAFLDFLDGKAYSKLVE